MVIIGYDPISASLITTLSELSVPPIEPTVAEESEESAPRITFGSELCLEVAVVDSLGVAVVDFGGDGDDNRAL